MGRGGGSRAASLKYSFYAKYVMLSVRFEMTNDSCSEEVTGDWTSLYNEGLHDLCFSPNVGYWGGGGG